jgi:hypothetical protein
MGEADREKEKKDKMVNMMEKIYDSHSVFK